MPLSPHDIEIAYRRIAPHIVRTPVLTSDALNQMLGGKAYFKYEGAQKTGAFKIRGALNALLALKERGALPSHVTAFSSGNHAQAVAYAANQLGIKATICIPEFCSAVKIKATRGWGAEVVITKTRAEAEVACAALTAQGATLISPFDNDDVIAGQGTCCYEALKDGVVPDAIFATIGGGGLASSTYLAAQLLCPAAQVIGCEPAMANDAARSVKRGRIYRWDKIPMTIADGARTPAIAERTFEYIKKLAEVIEVSEEDILRWMQQAALHLNVAVEPTSGVAVAASAQWLQKNKNKTVLVLLSGGNIDHTSQQAL